MNRSVALIGVAGAAAAKLRSIRHSLPGSDVIPEAQPQIFIPMPNSAPWKLSGPVEVTVKIGQGCLFREAVPTLTAGILFRGSHRDREIRD